MEKLVDIFCHAIRITDPLSIKIAVGIIGGGLPLFFLFTLFLMLGEFAAELREKHDAHLSQASPPQATRWPKVSFRAEVADSFANWRLDFSATRMSALPPIADMKWQFAACGA